jgi:hypothetical protein
VKHLVHTSDLLTRPRDQAPKDTIDLDWLLGHLQKRILLLLIVAIAILIPDLGVVASIAIAFPAVEMMLGRDRRTLPHFTHQTIVCDAAFHPLGKTISAFPQARRTSEPLAVAYPCRCHQTNGSATPRAARIRC